MMKKSFFPGILLWIFLIMLHIILIVKLLLEPWIGKKLESEITGKSEKYRIEIDRVRVSLIRSEVKLNGITVISGSDQSGELNLTAETEFIRIKGIRYLKAIFKKDLYIKSISVSNSKIKGKTSAPAKSLLPLVSPLKIRIGRLDIDNFDLTSESLSDAKSVSVREGVLTVYDFIVEKQDTLSSKDFGRLDFKAGELILVSADKMYSYEVGGMDYSEGSGLLAIDTLKIKPGFSDYDFTARNNYQINRFEAVLTSVIVHDFSHIDYFGSKSILSSYIEIGMIDMNVFRDKRKEFRHTEKPTFQDMLYNFPGNIRIDSAGLKNGKIIVKIHAPEANEPGSIWFDNISLRIYKITNDTIYKTENASFTLSGKALLMGKGQMTVSLSGRIYDSNNTVEVTGSLSEMEGSELNPILEKNAFIYVTSGRINEMKFSFTADNNKADGRMTMRYHGLDITIKNKLTDDTTALKERFISFIANRRVLDSNPTKDEDVREGIIAYKRDHERFFFHYFFQAILTGIRSSIATNQNNRKR